MRLLALFALTFTLAACSKPTDIVFGPEPLKQMAEQGDQFKRLSEEDRTLLAGYLGLTSIAQLFGGKDAKPITGRTVGEVLVDARAWKERMKVEELAEKAKQAEADALKEKVEAERKSISDKIQQAVTAVVTAKNVLPEDYSAGRAFEMLALRFAVENKSAKTISQLKGRMHFLDATGDEIGWLPVNFDDPISAGQTRTTTFEWKNTGMSNEIRKITQANSDSMKTRFEASAVAFADGEVIKVPGPSE
jgi:hypothetical protein